MWGKRSGDSGSRLICDLQLSPVNFRLITCSALAIKVGVAKGGGAGCSVTNNSKCCVTLVAIFLLCHFVVVSFTYCVFFFIDFVPLWRPYASPPSVGLSVRQARLGAVTA